jgi:hypothetical protein
VGCVWIGGDGARHRLFLCWKVRANGACGAVTCDDGDKEMVGVT